MKTLAFFNSRSGVGKSFLAYHLAFMFQRLGLRVVVADADPQTHLTGALIDDQRSEELALARPRQTILGAIEAVFHDDPLSIPFLEDLDGMCLLAGDIELSRWEGHFSEAWRDCLAHESHRAAEAFRKTAAFYAIFKKLEESGNVDILLLDLGPVLGAMNRAALLSADAIVVPLAPDNASRIALHALGESLVDWRAQWEERRKSAHARLVQLPSGSFSVIGYVAVQHTADVRRDAMRGNDEHALVRAFHEHVLRSSPPFGSDPECLARLRHLRGLLNLHSEARKPIFELKAVDGAVGSYAVAVKDAYVAFDRLAREIASRMGILLHQRD